MTPQGRLTVYFCIYLYVVPHVVFLCVVPRFDVQTHPVFGAFVSPFSSFLPFLPFFPISPCLPFVRFPAVEFFVFSRSFADSPEMVIAVTSCGHPRHHFYWLHCLAALQSVISVECSIAGVTTVISYTWPLNSIGILLSQGTCAASPQFIHPMSERCSCLSPRFLFRLLHRARASEVGCPARSTVRPQVCSLFLVPRIAGSQTSPDRWRLSLWDRGIYIICRAASVVNIQSTDPKRRNAMPTCVSAFSDFSKKKKIFM